MPGALRAACLRLLLLRLLVLVLQRRRRRAGPRRGARRRAAPGPGRRWPPPALPVRAPPPRRPRRPPPVPSRAPPAFASRACGTPAPSGLDSATGRCARGRHVPAAARRRPSPAPRAAARLVDRRLRLLQRRRPAHAAPCAAVRLGLHRPPIAACVRRPRPRAAPPRSSTSSAARPQHQLVCRDLGRRRRRRRRRSAADRWTWRRPSALAAPFPARPFLLGDLLLANLLATPSRLFLLLRELGGQPVSASWAGGTRPLLRGGPAPPAAGARIDAPLVASSSDAAVPATRRWRSRRSRAAFGAATRAWRSLHRPARS